MASPVHAQSDGTNLAPLTKLRLTVVHWTPSKSEFEVWAPLSGEFAVSPSGTVTFPVVGSIDASGLDATRLATLVATRLQEKLGLIDKPDATIQVIEFPPVYVVGDVAAPGQFKYWNGMTVLKALAMSGGTNRTVKEDSLDSQIKLVGELKGIDEEVLRTTARLSRLDAEFKGDKEFVPPPPTLEMTIPADIITQEKIIFTTRAKELARQARSLTDLRELLEAEVKVLRQKITDAESNMASLEAQLSNVKDLVKRGIVITSRQSELERALASYRADKLDQETAIMRARQAISETTRNLDGLQDQRQTQVATEMQKEQAGLDLMRVKRDTARKILVETMASVPMAGSDPADLKLSLTVVRRKGEKDMEIAATESTPLEPGDVVKVKIEVPEGHAIPPREKTVALDPKPTTAAADSASDFQ